MTILTSVSSRAMLPLVRKFGTKFPLVVVDEYPRSGGTWLARLLSSTTALPFVDNTTLPFLAPGIVRTHWTPDSRIAPQVYIARNGHDVMASWFNHRIRHLDTPKVARRYESIGLAAQDPTPSFAAFLEMEFADPGLGVQMNWNDHVERGLTLNGAHQSLVRYEDLVADTNGSLRKICNELFDWSPTDEALQLAVAANSPNMTRLREPLHLHQRSSVRVVGAYSWDDLVDEESAAIFERYAGPTMRRLGYES